MDPVTNTITGYMAGRAAGRRWCAQAPLAALIGANLPDLDFVSRLGGPVAVLELHRGVTHSLLAAPVVALAAVAMVGVAGLLFRRGIRWILPPADSVRWLRVWAAATAGVVSHCLLAWTNVYGARLADPVSARWFSLDLAPVIDPLLVALLVLGAGWLLLSGLVSGEMGARASSGRGVAVAVLLAVAGLLGARAVLHQRAVAVLDSRLYEQEAPRRVAAFPTELPWHWRGLVELDASYRVYEVNLLDASFDSSAGETLYKAGESPAIEAARSTRPFRVLAAFARYPLWRVTPAEDPPGATRVELTDLRFGVPGDGRFLASALVGPGGKVLESTYQSQAAEN